MPIFYGRIFAETGNKDHVGIATATMKTVDM